MKIYFSLMHKNTGHLNLKKIRDMSSTNKHKKFETYLSLRQKKNADILEKHVINNFHQ